MTNSESSSRDESVGSLSDRELLQRWVDNSNQQAATEFRERYIDRLLNCLEKNASFGRFSSESVAQSAFASFFIRARARKFQFDNDQDLWKLLITIALNKMYMRLRKKREINVIGDMEATTFRVGIEPTPEEVVAYVDTRTALDARLGDREKQYLRLRELGLNQSEIAAEMTISDRHVRRLKKRVEMKAWVFFDRE